MRRILRFLLNGRNNRNVSVGGGRHRRCGSRKRCNSCHCDWLRPKRINSEADFVIGGSNFRGFFCKQSTNQIGINRHRFFVFRSLFFMRTASSLEWLDWSASLPFDTAATLYCRDHFLYDKRVKNQ